jgi:hypothetical protein
MISDEKILTATDEFSHAATLTTIHQMTPGSTTSYEVQTVND